MLGCTGQSWMFIWSNTPRDGKVMTCSISGSNPCVIKLMIRQVDQKGEASNEEEVSRGRGCPWQKLNKKTWTETWALTEHVWNTFSSESVSTQRKGAYGVIQSHDSASPRAVLAHPLCVIANSYCCTKWLPINPLCVSCSWIKQDRCEHERRKETWPG